MTMLKERDLAGLTRQPAEQVLRKMRTYREGLFAVQVERRRRRYGPNVIAQERSPSWFAQLARAFWNHFVIVLCVLAGVMYATGDYTGAATIAVMVAISTLIRFWQEFRSGRAAAQLRALVTTTTTVVRRGQVQQIPMEEVVPGDIVRLAAGDLVPADLRLLSVKDLTVAQSALTGESVPVGKDDRVPEVTLASWADAGNLALMGTSVVSGTATGVVLAIGSNTYFGSMADELVSARPETAFDLGVKKVSWMLIRFMFVMVPLVFALNGFSQGDWGSAFLFAVAVAVGLTPEMLPVVVTANLARGGVELAKRKVVVKRLNAIQNLGGMDVLCSDKTGTLTEDRVVLERYLDVHGMREREVLRYALLNSRFQTGRPNVLDRAINDRVSEAEKEFVERRYTLVDEILFDFARRRMSVLLREVFSGEELLITKGAVEEVLPLCDRYRDGRAEQPMNVAARGNILRQAEQAGKDGLRVLAVAVGSGGSEDDLVFIGFLTFLDPPKRDAAEALRALARSGVDVKVVTGDEPLVAQRVCAQVGLETGEAVTGFQLDLMTDDEVRELTARTTLFARVNPTQKARVVRALRAEGRVVGFLGDGINDAAALREADVGISVDTAVDLAKESADIILLEKDLMVLEHGILLGRQTFGNTIKYLKMAASSNFGNVLSVLIASVVLPFQPMLAAQLLVQNLAYDLSQLSIPWDRMDREFLARPQRWNDRDLGRFMLRIGPVSSIFDLTTFAVLWFVFAANSPATAALFHTGWFVEGLLSQVLIVHMIRTRKVPFLQSRATLPVLLATGAVMLFGLWLPFSPLAAGLGMVALPVAYFPWLLATLVGYCLTTQLVKSAYIRRYGTWL